MKLFRLLIACVLVCSLSLATIARVKSPEEWTHPAGWKFWLPDNMKATPDGDMLEVEDKAGKVYIAFFVPKNVKDIGSALDEVDKELSAWLKNIHYDKPTESKVDGIDELFITGTGKDRDDDTAMEFDLGVYHKKGKLLMVLGVTTAENFDKYDKTFTKILDSIR